MPFGAARWCTAESTMCWRAVVLAAACARASAPERVAVVFAGHPRTFLSDARVRENVRVRGVGAFCASAACEVFALAACVDGSL